MVAHVASTPFLVLVTRGSIYGLGIDLDQKLIADG
jgi:hypothetical protein